MKSGFFSSNVPTAKVSLSFLNFLRNSKSIPASDHELSKLKKILQSLDALFSKYSKASSNDKRIELNDYTSQLGSISQTE